MGNFKEVVIENFFDSRKANICTAFKVYCYV